VSKRSGRLVERLKAVTSSAAVFMHRRPNSARLRAGSAGPVWDAGQSERVPEGVNRRHPPPCVDCAALRIRQQGAYLL